MFEMLHQLNDNQIALIGCMGVVAFSMLLLSVSYHSNSNHLPVAQKQKLKETKNRIGESVSEKRAA